MNQFGLTFHHFGLAVRTPETAFAYLASLGYSDGAEALDPLQNVNLALRHHEEMPDVEVIWPAESGGPVEGLLKEREGLVYHLCYIADDPAGTLRQMKTAGLRVLTVSPPKPAILFGGASVSFHNILGLGLIEIIHGPTLA